MHRKGITLLELLIAITLSTIIITTTLTVMRSIVMFVKKNQHFGVIYEANILKLDYYLSSIFPFVFRQNNRFKIFFNGTPDNISFISLYDPRGDTNIPRIFKIYLKKGCVLLKYTPIYQNNIDFNRLSFNKVRWQSDKIICNVKDMKFSYLINGKKIKEIHDRIPDSIKLDIFFSEGNLSLFIKIPDSGLQKLKLTKRLYENLI
jgi:hypothetical protein